MSTTYPTLNLTEFPDDIDGKYTMRDIEDDDVPRIKKYESYISKGNISAANSYLAANTDLIPTIFNADKWNRHEHMILAIENYYKNDIRRYIMSVVRYRDAYNSSTSYKKFDVVSRTVEGVTTCYMAGKSVPVGIVPGTSEGTDYWIPITIQGEKGDPGLGVSYAGLYDSTVTYSENECVSCDSALWYSKTNNNIGHNPTTDTGTYWEKIFDVSPVASAVRFGDNVTLQAWRESVDSTLTTDHASIVSLNNNDLIIYISTNGDNNNDGLTAEAPLLNVSEIKNKYKNIKQLTIKFLDGTYTDRIRIDGIPSVTITNETNSANNFGVVFTGGVEIENCSAYIRYVFFDATTHYAPGLLIRNSKANIGFCKFVDRYPEESTRSGAQFITSQVDIRNSYFYYSKYAVGAFYASYINMANCQGDNIQTVCYSEGGSIINYGNDNTIEATNTFYTGNDAGIAFENNVLAIANGGTGANNIADLKSNIAIGYSSLFSGSVLCAGIINGFGYDSASLYNVFSITIRVNENGTQVDRAVTGYKSGGTIKFDGYANKCLISGDIVLNNDSSNVYFSAYRISNLNVNAAITEGFTVVAINGIV